jgi:hypothetical protein
MYSARTGKAYLGLQRRACRTDLPGTSARCRLRFLLRSNDWRQGAPQQKSRPSEAKTAAKLPMRFPEMDAARPRRELCSNINGALLWAAPIPAVYVAAGGSVRREIAIGGLAGFLRVLPGFDVRNSPHVIALRARRKGSRPASAY